MDRPRQLIVTVTDQCNHACDMCYYHESLNRRVSLLSLDEYERVCRDLHEIELLLISGGEPFLRAELADIVACFHRFNRTRTVFIPTNGSIPAEIVRTVTHMLDLLPDLHLTLMLSLEGLAEEHDRIHGRPGAFNAVIQSIRELGRLRLHRHIKGKRPFGILLNSVVSSQNALSIPPLMDYVRARVRVGSHTFSPMRGSGPSPDCHPPSPERFAALVQAAQPHFEHYLKGRSDALQAIVDRYDLWTGLVGGGGLPHQCQAGNYIGVIEPDGGVRLCELTPVIGQLREADFDFGRVWHSRAAAELRKQLINCACTHACFINASQRYYGTRPSPERSPAMTPGMASGRDPKQSS